MITRPRVTRYRDIKTWKQPYGSQVPGFVPETAIKIMGIAAGAAAKGHRVVAVERWDADGKRKRMDVTIYWRSEQ